MIDEWYYDRAEWKETFALIPRRCDLSNRWIWGRHVCGTRMVTGPGDPVTIKIWNHRHEHTIYKLKGKLK
jgi:hypothetical protein